MVAFFFRFSVKVSLHTSMNYDPIHDTFVSQSTKETSVTNPENENDTNSKGASVNEVVESPTRKAFSIENLMGPGSTPSSIVNTEEGETETDAEHDNDHDFTAANSSEVEGDFLPKEKGEKKSGKAKKTSASSASKGFRHLKKSDGEPFWRRDIQYDFLQELFDDETKAFTNYFPFCDIPSANNEPRITFSELYIRTLAESGKCSKILKERLLKDVEMGKSVGKVCLLVNAGRMNTTVNFVPEMRSTLRTYHSIPSLQADPVYGGSKPLQDTPRLKSILKAVTDVHEELKSLDDILENPPADKPNTNLVQLLFFLSNNVKAIKFHHDNSNEYTDSNNFMEFFLNSHIQPKNRARRFLWLVYTYLETSFTENELELNPFNPKEIPPIELIPDNEVDEFDKDTDFEIEYSEKMYKTRLRYLADEEHNNNPKRGNKSKKEKEVIDTEDNTFDESIDTSLEQATLPSGKRPLPVDDAKARKRKGKRNPAMHNTVISSPLTKNVVTSSAEVSNSNDPESEQIVETKDEANNNSGNGNLSSNTEGNGSTGTFEEVPLPNYEHLSFPIEGLSSIVDLYAGSKDIPLTPESTVSITTHNNIITKSKPVIRQVRNSSKAAGVEFSKKTDVLTDWLYKFFQYKKSSSNGLLGMEWESIRYDLVHGSEEFIYRELGRYVNSQQDLHEMVNNANGSNNAVDANGDELGFDYLQIHDFNHFNEKNSFLVNLISYCQKYFIEQETQNLKDNTQIKKLIKFDLLKEEVNYAYDI